MTSPIDSVFKWNTVTLEFLTAHSEWVLSPSNAAQCLYPSDCTVSRQPKKRPTLQEICVFWGNILHQQFIFLMNHMTPYYKKIFGFLRTMLLRIWIFRNLKVQWAFSDVSKEPSSCFLKIKQSRNFGKHSKDAVKYRKTRILSREK
jgi:hypothetical protein